MLVGGRFHDVASHWLRRWFLLRTVESSVNSRASQLACYIAYLQDERGLNHPDERHADLLVATEDDLRALYKASSSIRTLPSVVLLGGPSFRP
jgi:hypothetical protein